MCPIYVVHGEKGWGFWVTLLPGHAVRVTYAEDHLRWAVQHDSVEVEQRPPQQEIIPTRDTATDPDWLNPLPSRGHDGGMSTQTGVRMRSSMTGM